jgi:hypothetical protein
MAEERDVALTNLRKGFTNNRSEGIGNAGVVLEHNRYWPV